MCKRLISMVMSLVLLLGLFTICAYAEENNSLATITTPGDGQESFINIINEDSIYGANLVSNNAVYHLDEKAQNFNLKYDFSRGFVVSLNLNGTPIEFDVLLGYANKDKTKLAGYSENESQGYVITNFKIDRNANIAILMKPNEVLANTTVLSIGFRTPIGENLYFQCSINNSAMDLIDQHCQQLTNIYNSVDFNRLYKYYLTNSSPETVLMEYTDVVTEYKNSEANLNGDVRVRSLLDVFPKSYFTGSNMYNTITGKYGSHYYARYSSYFVGTTNVLTYFVGMRETFVTQYGTQNFYADYILDYDTAVIYNPDTGTASIWGDLTNNFKVSSPTITIKCVNTDGCIIKRSQYAHIQGSSLEKVASVMLSWTNYLSNIVNSVQTLTSKESNQMESYGTDLNNQLSIYGKRISAITATAKTFSAEEDHLLLELTGYNVTSASAQFSCEVKF